LAGALRPSAIPIAGGFAAPDTARIAARRDIALTAALLAHLDALAHGEVSPDSTGAEWHAPPPEALGDSALAAGAELAFRAGLAAAEAGLRPGSAAYLPLASRVAPLLGDTAPAPLVLSDSATLRAGRRDSAVVALRARLVADGDLDTSRAGGALYDAAVVRAVRRFQERHGLMPTGVVDPATRAALAESPRSRALTVMANLERYRWLPRRPEPGTLVADLGEGSLALFGGTDEPLRLALVTVPGGSCGAPLVADSVVAVRGDSARLRLTLRSGDSVVIASARGRRAAPQCLVAPELGRLTSALAGTAGPMLRRVVVVRPTARVGDDGSLRFAPDSSGSDARLRVALAARGDTLPAPVCAAPRRP
jgi:peptidoglycan hydrolase-like protein with peptidoglycan-binding domain